MTSVDELRALKDRVDEAEWPDRDTDADVCVIFRQHPFGPDHWLKDPIFPFRNMGKGRVAAFDNQGELPGGGWTSLEYTASIDAALALVERVLPDANCYGAERQGPDWEAHVGRNYAPREECWIKEGFCKTGPLAILSALLSALIARAEKEGDAGG